MISTSGDSGLEPKRLVTGGASDRGQARPRNEDAFAIAELGRELRVTSSNVEPLVVPDCTVPGAADDGWLLLVADGMGGEGDGDVASAAAIQSVLTHICTGKAPSRDALSIEDSLDGIRSRLGRALSQGDNEINAMANHPDNSPTMGTTLTLAYARLPWLYIAHAGDSRAYLHRKGKLERLTTDHTMAEKMAQRGMVLEASSRFHHMLYNALGAGRVSLKPELRKLRLAPGDTLLLCSDGLIRHLSEPEIEQWLSQGQNESPQLLSEKLVEVTNSRGAVDNVTVAIGRVS